MWDHFNIFTNQEWKQGNGPIFSSYNPATLEVLWQGQMTTKEQIDEVVQHAQVAFKEWSNLTIDERSQYLDAFAKLLEYKRDFLAEVISKETGKPLWDSLNEIASMIGKIGISLEAYGRRCAGMIRDMGAVRSITRHKPHGVIGVLAPFNFPGHLPNGHIIPALLAGNTVIFKPSELTPWISEEIVKCWEKTGLPKGVLNLIQGGHETGKALVNHPDLKGIFFTGSYEVGKWIAETLGPKPEKIMALEMGGNNPLIVSQVADLEAAAYLTIQSTYLTTGQRCTCTRRLIVIVNDQAKQFIDCLASLTRDIVIGAYTDQPEPYIGPIIREEYAKRVIQAQESLNAAGGIPLLEAKLLKKGTGFISPGLIDVTNVEDRIDEEIFGPLLQIIYVQDLKEAIKEANRTKYGLAAGLLSDDPEEFSYFYNHAQAGVVNWNTPTTGACSIAPFGGIKSSGNYRPSAYYAADYCSYPIASMEVNRVKMPDQIAPGLNFKKNMENA